MAGDAVSPRARRPLAVGRIRLVRAHGALGRLRGLLCRGRAPGPRSGLWLAPCRAIHTLGMRHPIDAAFLDADGRLLRLARNLPPGRVALCLRAASVVELAVNGVDTPLRYRRRLRVAVRRAQAPGKREACGKRGRTL